MNTPSKKLIFRLVEVQWLNPYIIYTHDDGSFYLREFNNIAQEMTKLF